MRLGKHQALDGNELTDAANTLEYVFDAVRDRVKTLTSESFCYLSRWQNSLLHNKRCLQATKTGP